MALFALPQRPGDLTSANQGTANAQYRQITSTRSVEGVAFPNGIMQFRFETGGTTWFVPDKSYFRIRYKLTQCRANAAAMTPIQEGADIAPNMGLAANLFKSCEVTLNGQTVERIGERLPQVDALKTRMKRSKAWMQSVGKHTNHWQHNFASRHQHVALEGYEVDTNHTIEANTLGKGLNRQQAGFTAIATASVAAGVMTFISAGADILNGAQKLRPGDTILLVTGEIFVISRALTALTAAVHFVNTANTAAPGAADFNVFKVSTATQNDAVGKNIQELIWQPPLGFFDVSHAIPPGGNWTVEFDPENVSQYKTKAVESQDSLFNGGLGLIPQRQTPEVPANNILGDFQFEVEQMYLYLYTVDAARFESGEYFLDIQNVRVQLDNLPTDCTSLTQKNFDVNGKSNALTLAFQDQLAGNNTRFSRSKFKIRSSLRTGLPFNAASFVEGQEMGLSRFFINYNNMQKPAPDFDGDLTEIQGDSTLDQSNRMVQRWADSLMQTGAYHSEGGSENLKDWIKRGPYYHFLWPKDATEDNTRVNVNVQFQSQFSPANSNHKIMLFNWWRTAYHIIHRNGRVEKLSVEAL